MPCHHIGFNLCQNCSCEEIHKTEWLAPRAWTYVKLIHATWKLDLWSATIWPISCSLQVSQNRDLLCPLHETEILKSGVCCSCVDGGGCLKQRKVLSKFFQFWVSSLHMLLEILSDTKIEHRNICHKSACLSRRDPVYKQIWRQKMTWAKAWSHK